MAPTYDLTKGSLSLHFRRLAIPAAIGLVFTTMYNVVDVFFAGLIGTDAQAGLAISFPGIFPLHHFWVWIVFCDDGACRQCPRREET